MKKLIYFLLVGFVFWGCNSENESDVLIDPETGMPIENVTQYSIENYVYEIILGPIPPTERRDACQIPVETLKKMTTQAVIQAVLDHPMQMEIFLVNEFIRGYNGVYKDNNALIELAKRKDADMLLLERLKAINPVGPDGFKHVILEFLFSNYLGKLDDRKIVVEISLNNYKLRNSNGRGIYDPVTFLLISKAMLVDNYAPFVKAVNENQSLQSFFNYFEGQGGFMTEIFYHENLVPQTILDFANRYLNE